MILYVCLSLYCIYIIYYISESWNCFLFDPKILQAMMNKRALILFNLLFDSLSISFNLKKNLICRNQALSPIYIDGF